MTVRERPAKFIRTLATKSPRKTTVNIFHTALERGRGGMDKGGGAGGGVRMTGGGVTGGGGVGLAGVALAGSEDGGWSSISNQSYRNPRQRASANTTPFCQSAPHQANRRKGRPSFRRKLSAINRN
jgi:hypothetical protein